MRAHTFMMFAQIVLAGVCLFNALNDPTPIKWGGALIVFLLALRSVIVSAIEGTKDA